MEKKYELTDETIEWNGHILHRIKLLKDIYPDGCEYYKEELGGFIEKEENLSHEGDCWIDEDAKVYGNAKIRGSVLIANDSEIYDNAVVAGNKGALLARGHCKVYQNAVVIDTHVTSDSFTEFDIYGDTLIINSEIEGMGSIYGNTLVKNSSICGYCRIYDNAQICDSSISTSYVYGNIRIHGTNLENCRLFEGSEE